MAEEQTVKLTIAQRKEQVLAALKSGKKDVDICNDFGVSKTYVYKLKKVNQ